jgi:hypothetical protein
MKTLIIGTILSTAAVANAATVSVASTIPAGGNVHGPGNTQVALKNSAGVTLPAGMRVRVGFFVGYTAELDATLKAPGGVFTLMNSSSPNQFVPLGEPPLRVGYGDDTTATNLTKLIGGTIRWNTNISNVSYSGAENSPSDNNTIATGGVARGTKLFVLVYNTSSLTPDINAAGFEYGIFSDSSFIIPETGTATTSLNVALVDVASEVYYGALGNSLHLAPIIPEPSVGLLSLLAAAITFRRKR